MVLLCFSETIVVISDYKFVVNDGGGDMVMEERSELVKTMIDSVVEVELSNLYYFLKQSSPTHRLFPAEPPHMFLTN